MKNDKNNITRQRRAGTGYQNRIDILVNPATKQGTGRVSSSRRKRRINYTKKIMNDPLIMTI